jgi:hypothetical protein
MKKIAKIFVEWLSTTKILSFPRKIAARVILYVISTKNGEIIYYNDPERLKVIALSKKIRNERESLLSYIEAYNICMAVKRTLKVNGDIAEVGVYKGGSAKLICENKENKLLHLFDTFEGLPDLCEIDDPKQFHKGQFLCSFENVKDYLREYQNVRFYKGLFPLTAEPLKNKKFSFVNLDVDLYKSTLSCLEFFYPKMNRGGIIISHDYSGASGVRKAFDEFFEDKQEAIIELSGSQCLIAKC